MNFSSQHHIGYSVPKDPKIMCYVFLWNGRFPCLYMTGASLYSWQRQACQKHWNANPNEAWLHYVSELWLLYIVFPDKPSAFNCNCMYAFIYSFFFYFNGQTICKKWRKCLSRVSLCFCCFIPVSTLQWYLWIRGSTIRMTSMQNMMSIVSFMPALRALRVVLRNWTTGVGGLLLELKSTR